MRFQTYVSGVSAFIIAAFAVALVVLPGDDAWAHAAPEEVWVVDSISDPGLDCLTVTEARPGIVTFDKQCGPAMDVEPLECSRSACGGDGIQLESGEDVEVLHGPDVGFAASEFETGDEFWVLLGWTLDGEDEGTVRVEGHYDDDAGDMGCGGCSSGGSEARIPYGELIIAALLLGAIGLFRREPEALEDAREVRSRSGA